VEVISRKPLDRFIEERIFRPLRMNDRRDFQTLTYQAIVGSARTARASN
jgi:CubicO group peptidase (beta-lactamase class C family)